jgi:hypothetical protein
LGDTAALSARRRNSPVAEPGTFAAAGVRCDDGLKSSAPPVPRPLHGHHTVDGFQEIGVSVDEIKNRRPADNIA